MSFRSLPDSELQALSDDALVDYGRRARDAGATEAAGNALAFLVWGHAGNVLRRVRMKVPPGQAEDVADEIVVRAIAAAFDGSSVGEFHSWLNTITQRGVADFHRRAKRRPRHLPLPTEHIGDDEVWAAEPAEPDATGAVELWVVIDQVTAELDAKHARVIELHVFGALPAAAVCDRIDGMTEANVAQIASRFRAKLRQRLDPGDGG